MMLNGDDVSVESTMVCCIPNASPLMPLQQLNFTDLKVPPAQKTYTFLRCSTAPSSFTAFEISLVYE